MSGFAGVVRLDGRPPDAEDAARLLEAIAHRGGDGSGSWSDETALIVHAMLRTTPQSLADSQPFVDDGLVVAGDLRLDDGDEGVGDAARVALAYRRWGAECPRHLEGDFAFAVWDAATRTLFCARDPFGVKPFVYALLPGRLFAFGSLPRAPLALPEVPRQVDEERLAAFLDVRFEDLERTFYRDVKRLPGGCTLTLRDGRAAVTRYWSADSVAPLRLSSDAEYAEGYREQFTRAVRARMRVAEPWRVGSMLSGGLDSSSITCVARDAGSSTLPVFSWIFSDVPAADEREYQEIVPGVERHVIDSATSDWSPWSDLSLLLPDGPPYAANFYLNHAMARLARPLGIRAMLDGLGGDSTISRGAVRPLELFVRGRFLTLAAELRALAATNPEKASASQLFRSSVLAPLIPPFVRRAYDRLRGRPPRPRRGPYPPHLSVRADHIADFRSPLLAEGLELFDRVMSLSQVEGRYPFFDRRLVEYCISLPSAQKLAGGYPRVVARRALRGTVPERILWRTGKGRPGLHILPALGLSSSGDFQAAMKFWSAAAAEEWLRQLRS